MHENIKLARNKIINQAENTIDAEKTCMLQTWIRTFIIIWLFKHTWLSIDHGFRIWQCIVPIEGIYVHMSNIQVEKAPRNMYK